MNGRCVELVQRIDPKDNRLTRSSGLQDLDWQAIVTEHGDVVWQTAHRLLRHEADTADCFQEVFVSAMRMSQHQSIRCVRGLLVRLATVRAIDRLRQRARRQGRESDCPDWSVLPSKSADPAKAVQDREWAEVLTVALAQLPRQQAEAFSLRHLSDMSQAEVGEELGINANTAGVLIYRARLRLRQILADRWNEETCDHETRRSTGQGD